MESVVRTDFEGAKHWLKRYSSWSSDLQSAHETCRPIKAITSYTVLRSKATRWFHNGGTQCGYWQRRWMTLLDLLLRLAVALRVLKLYFDYWRIYRVFLLAIVPRIDGFDLIPFLSQRQKQLKSSNVKLLKLRLERWNSSDSGSEMEVWRSC
jgi:hypothetical protein